MVVVYAVGAQATVLPEERADVLYHSYEGDGVEITGPAILVRKSFLDKVSVKAQYYVDNVSGASIDVRSYGSPYTETRQEVSVGADVLNDKSVLSVGFTNSSENDYDANTYHLSFSQDFFGDLSTLAIGYGYGRDEVMKRGDSSFLEEVQRHNYSISLTQVLAKWAIMSINLEGTAEEGYLQNPYRKSSILFSNASEFSGRTESFVNEVYPSTRTSQAISLRSRFYLPYRASVKAELRYYSDSWEVQGMNYEIGYIHPFDNWPLTLEFTFRGYTQEAAYFYSDFIDLRSPTAKIPKFHGRDKELSEFDATTFGFGAKWAFSDVGVEFIETAVASLNIDKINFDYQNFRNAANAPEKIGFEPLFSYDATVIRLLFTATY